MYVNIGKFEFLQFFIMFSVVSSYMSKVTG